MTSRGQATAFIILGILVIALAGTVYYFRSEIFRFLQEKELSGVAVPPEVERVNVYTESCLRETLEEGALLVGSQGGYVDVPSDDFDISTANVLSNSLDFFGEGSLRVPYWFYTTPNNIERVQVPTREDIEGELAKYVESNIGLCLREYAPLRMQGYDISSGSPEVSVTLNEQSAIVAMQSKTLVKFKEKEFTLPSFTADVEVPLGSLYESARELFAYHMKTSFIENLTLDFMAVYDEVPYAESDFECSTRSWHKLKIAADLKEILQTNIPLVKIKGTEYALVNKDEELLVYDALEERKRDLTVGFMYNVEWPLLMDVLGQEGPIVKGKSVTVANAASRFTLPLFCLNDYHFVYDIKYPVIVTLEQDDYAFQFAYLVVLDNNQPRANQFDLASFDELSEVCENPLTRMKVFTLAPSSDGSFVPIRDVDVSYQCLSTVCDIGATRLEGSEQALTAYFPPCVNGQLIAEKEGYHPARETISTMEEATVSVVLEPYYELPVEVMVQAESGVRAISPTEQVLFQFTHRETGYETSLVYPGQDKVRLIAGTYDVSSILMTTTSGGFKIDETPIKVCVDKPKSGVLGFLGVTDRECMTETIEGTTLDAVMTGGGSFVWSPQRDELTRSSKVVLYTVRGVTPTSYNDLMEFEDNKFLLSQKIKVPDLA